MLAESARENVLLPAPAMPVTTTRRPTEIPGGMSLANRNSVKPSSGTSAYCLILGGRGGIPPIQRSGPFDDQVRGVPVVPFRAQESLASSKDAGWASPAHITFAGDRRDWEWRGCHRTPN